MREIFSFVSARSGPQPEFPLQEAMAKGIEGFFKTNDFGVFAICTLALVGCGSIAGLWLWSRRP